jgi:hypothetical protein
MPFTVTAAGTNQNIAKGHVTGFFNIYTQTCTPLGGGSVTCTTLPTVIPVNDISFSATSDITGTNARGSVTFSNTLLNPNQSITGDVTCLNVFVGTFFGLTKFAGIGGVITGGKNVQVGAFNSFFISAVDNDDLTGENSSVSPDSINIAFLNTGGQGQLTTPCQAFTSNASGPISSGDIEVEHG